MAATLTDLTATISVQITAVGKKGLDLSTPQDALSYSYEKSFAWGSGALQVNCMFHDSRLIGAASNETLDLAGVLTDAFGSTVTFANVKVLFIENLSTNAADCILTVGAAAGTQFDTWLGGATEVIKLSPGEGKLLICRVDADGYVATGGADDLLKLANAGSTGCTYKIIILGDSA